MHAHTVSFLEKPCGLRYSSLRQHLELKSIPNMRLHESMIKLSVCMYVCQRFDFLSFFGPNTFTISNEMQGGNIHLRSQFLFLRDQCCKYLLQLTKYCESFGMRHERCRN